MGPSKIDEMSFAHYYDTMLIEIDRNGWEAFITLVNNLCKNQQVTLKTREKNKEVFIVSDRFVSVETYLGAATGPLLMILLGGSGQIGCCYFVKKPEKITIEQTQKQIKSLRIQTTLGETILAFKEKEKKTQKTYHHTLNPKKASP